MRWLKIETGTPDKRALVGAARDLGVSQGDSFLAFFRLYSWLDETTADGRMDGITPDMVDQRAGLAGFGEALARHGWLTFDAGGMTVTNWGEHNGQCAKRRAMKAKWMAEYRERLHLKSNIHWGYEGGPL